MHAARLLYRATLRCTLRRFSRSADSESARGVSSLGRFGDQAIAFWASCPKLMSSMSRVDGMDGATPEHNGGNMKNFNLFVFDLGSPSSSSLASSASNLAKVEACLSGIDDVAVSPYAERVAQSSAVPEKHVEASEDVHLDIMATLAPALTTKELGRVFLYAPLLDSTQRVVEHIGKSSVLNVVCVADTQTAGRGRGSNVWSSPPGCLLFSFNFSSTDGANLPFVQYIISLALIRSVKSINGCDCLPIKIKWPNDIYAKVGRKSMVSSEAVGKDGFTEPPKHGDYVKIGGVLCQSTYDYQSKSFAVVVGVGLNVLNEHPTTCLERLRKNLSGVEDRGREISRATVLASFLNTVEPMIELFNSDGFQPFQEEYLEHWLHSRQTVTAVDLARGSQDQENMPEDGIPLTITGIAESSGLLAMDPSTGQQYELLPDGNSLDFMRGLLKRKL